jgi:hypothetical protein
MQFPNTIQSALLFDRPVTHLEAIAQTFMRVEAAKTGTHYNVAESNPGLFCRLYGGDQLMVTLEFVNRPADIGVFQLPLGSAVTKVLCPDISERLAKHRSHILVNVSHGALGDDPKIAELMAKMGMPMPGTSLPQFKRRLEACALLSRMAQENMSASAIHWTQSNQLLSAETFDVFSKPAPPGHLHIHPYLFGGGESADGKALAGILTFGARHFVGREIVIEPSPLPWMANFETILAFLRVAVTANGYVIPHGDTFGPEDNSLSYRVLHRPPVQGEVPIYELVPLLYREYDFQSESYVPRDRVFDDRSPPADLLPKSHPAREELMEEWRTKRALAEGVGGQFEVRARTSGPNDVPPVPPAFGRRVFGRRGSTN